MGRAECEVFMATKSEIRGLLSRLDDEVADIAFANPITEARLDAILAAISLEADDTILDIGARRCELAIRLIERYACRAVVIDNVPGFAEAAMKRARGRISPDRLSTHEQTATEFFTHNPACDYAATICVGSGHAFGDYVDMLRGLILRTRPGGLAFVGYPFRLAPPNAMAHNAHIELAKRLGLELELDWAASHKDWERFHNDLLAGYQQYATRHPANPDSRRFLDPELQPEYSAYLHSIRQTTGFGYGLLRITDRAKKAL